MWWTEQREQTTPVKELGGKHPLLQATLERCCEKWTARTKKDANAWPKGGSWDLKLIVLMEEKIRNYERHDKSQKRAQKRETELQALKMFLDEARERKRGEQEAYALTSKSREKERLYPHMPLIKTEETAPPQESNAGQELEVRQFPVETSNTSVQRNKIETLVRQMEETASKIESARRRVEERNREEQVKLMEETESEKAGKRLMEDCLERLRMAAQEVQGGNEELEEESYDSCREEEEDEDDCDEKVGEEKWSQKSQAEKAKERMMQHPLQPQSEEVACARGYLDGETIDGKRIFLIGHKTVSRKLKDDEDSIQWIDEETTIWEAMAETDTNSTCVLKASFRNTIIRASPLAVQTTAKSEWKLNSMSHEEFKECNMELYREDKERKEIQEADLQRKLLHMQLEEHMESEKAVQATMMAEAPAVVGSVQVSATQIPTATPVTTEALIELMLVDSSAQERGRGREKRKGELHEPVCYACGSTDHLTKACPQNVFNRNNENQSAESQMQLASQKAPQGPTNPEALWGSQFQ